MRLNSFFLKRLSDGFIQGVFKMAEFAANLLSETLRERSGSATFGSAVSKSLASGYSAAAWVGWVF
ncbi:MAG: hypothetical protein KME45_14330 [Stenomitos rutilans HA7619-LM2]|nr:hypothetical protein [Stenomitos rutilans HA7619-LM2]